MAFCGGLTAFRAVVGNSSGLQYGCYCHTGERGCQIIGNLPLACLGGVPNAKSVFLALVVVPGTTYRPTSITPDCVVGVDDNAVELLVARTRVPRDHLHFHERLAVDEPHLADPGTLTTNFHLAHH